MPKLLNKNIKVLQKSLKLQEIAFLCCGENQTKNITQRGVSILLNYLIRAVNNRQLTAFHKGRCNIDCDDTKFATPENSDEIHINQRNYLTFKDFIFKDRTQKDFANNPALCILNNNPFWEPIKIGLWHKIIFSFRNKIIIIKNFWSLHWKSLAPVILGVIAIIVTLFIHFDGKPPSHPHVEKNNTNKDIGLNSTHKE